MIQEAREKLSVKPGRPERWEHEYVRCVRCGVAQVFLEVEPLTGRRHVGVGERRTRRDWALWIQGMLRTRYPQAERVVLILDNLNTHGIESLYETFASQEARSLAERLEIHHTPKHGQLATPFHGPGLRVNSRLTCPPTSWRVQWIPFQEEGYNEGMAAYRSVLTPL